MSVLRYVTLTGVDEKTSFAGIKRLSDRFVFAEWGVLYSPARAGSELRYPSLEWIEKFALKAKRLNIALHLCGASVKLLLDNASKWGENLDPQAKRLFALAEKFGRVQLNTVAGVDQAERFEALIERLTRTEKRTCVILQWNDKNQALCQRLWHLHGFECLVDASGGRGVEPASWPDLNPYHIRRRGFAGGLCPENLAGHLDTLAKLVPNHAFWVDMESKLRKPYREDNRLDLSRCEAVLTVAQEWWEAYRRHCGAAYGSGNVKISSLSELWLDWWTGHIQGYNMVVPPADACRAVYLYRKGGSFEGFNPSQDKRAALSLFRQEKVNFVSLPGGQWAACVAGSSYTMRHRNMVIAGLRAVVASRYGNTVPRNPFE